ncbi:MAG: hypothetical protein JKY50_22665 [Oleispira sp.]|nr:hypothetical protein [Oleispira sp.]
MSGYTKFEGSARKREVNREPVYSLSDLAGISGVPIITIKSRAGNAESERVGFSIPDFHMSIRNKRMYLLKDLKEWHNKWQERTGGELL